MAEHTVVFYVSGHGFGHASRSIEVVNALIERRPGVRTIIRSSVASWLVQRTAHPSVELTPVEVDTGVVQIDSLHLDAASTIARAEAFMTGFPARVADEAEFLHASKADLVVSDVPPLGIAAADAAGLPAVALANFTWDWIYEKYAGGGHVARLIGDAYAHTTLAIRLPMWGGFETMPVVADVPFVARHPRRDPHELRIALGLPTDRALALVSFGGYGIDGIDVDALTRLSGFHVLLPGMIDESAMYGGGFRYEDLVRAADVVVSKPGYGIVSDCIAGHTALLYTSRGDFREYQVLVDAMPRWLRCGFIGHDDLYAGRWQPYLDAVMAQPAPAAADTSGAAAAADMLLELLR